MMRAIVVHLGSSNVSTLSLEPLPAAASPSTYFEAPDWVRAVGNRLKELAQLSDNWDGRGAQRLSRRDAADAVAFLERVMESDVLPPWIGPLNTGGVQLTWRADDIEVEAVFDSARSERLLLVSRGEDEDEAEMDREADLLFAEVIDYLRTPEPVLA